MKDLCTRFCHEELKARLRGESMTKQVTWNDQNDDEIYGQEEVEEEE